MPAGTVAARRGRDEGRVMPRLVLPLLAMAAIWFLGAIPGGPPGLPGLDKLVHAALWFVLAALWLFALSPTRMRPVSRVALALALASAWGVVDEWHQSSVPGRSSSLADLVADVAGASLAGAIALIRAALGNDRGVRPASGGG